MTPQNGPLLPKARSTNASRFRQREMTRIVQKRHRSGAVSTTQNEPHSAKEAPKRRTRIRIRAHGLAIDRLATDGSFKNSGAATESRVVSTTNGNSMRGIKAGGRLTEVAGPGPGAPQLAIDTYMYNCDGNAK